MLSHTLLCCPDVRELTDHGGTGNTLPSHVRKWGFREGELAAPVIAGIRTTAQASAPTEGTRGA